jgi:hypothetical protein
MRINVEFELKGKCTVKCLKRGKSPVLESPFWHPMLYVSL